MATTKDDVSQINGVMLMNNGTMTLPDGGLGTWLHTFFNNRGVDQSDFGPSRLDYRSEMYIGESETVSRSLGKVIRNLNLKNYPFILELDAMPLIETDILDEDVVTINFDDFFAPEEAPDGSVPRTFGHTTEREQFKSVPYQIGYKFNIDSLRTSDGQALFSAYVYKISQIFAEWTGWVTISKLVDDPKAEFYFFNKWMEKTVAEKYERVKHERTHTFIGNKNPRGGPLPHIWNEMQIMVDDNRDGGPVTYIIYNPDKQGMIKFFLDETSNYSKAGPAANNMFLNNTTAEGIFTAKYKAMPTFPKDGNEGRRYSLLNGQVVTGEFTVWRNEMLKFRAEDVNIRQQGYITIFSEAANDYVDIQAVELNRKCFRWDRNGNLDQAKHAGCDDDQFTYLRKSGPAAYNGVDPAGYVGADHGFGQQDDRPAEWRACRTIGDMKGSSEWGAYLKKTVAVLLRKCKMDELRDEFDTLQSINLPDAQEGAVAEDVAAAVTAGLPPHMTRLCRHLMTLLGANRNLFFNTDNRIPNSLHRDLDKNVKEFATVLHQAFKVPVQIVNNPGGAAAAPVMVPFDVDDEQFLIGNDQRVIRNKVGTSVTEPKVRAYQSAMKGVTAAQNALFQIAHLHGVIEAVVARQDNYNLNPLAGGAVAADVEEEDEPEDEPPGEPPRDPLAGVEEGLDDVPAGLHERSRVVGVYQKDRHFPYLVRVAHMAFAHFKDVLLGKNDAYLEIVGYLDTMMEGLRAFMHNVPAGEGISVPQNLFVVATGLVYYGAWLVKRFGAIRAEKLAHVVISVHSLFELYQNEVIPEREVEEICQKAMQLFEGDRKTWAIVSSISKPLSVVGDRVLQAFRGAAYKNAYFVMMADLALDVAIVTANGVPPHSFEIKRRPVAAAVPEGIRPTAFPVRDYGVAPLTGSAYADDEEENTNIPTDPFDMSKRRRVDYSAYTAGIDEADHRISDNWEKNGKLIDRLFADRIEAGVAYVLCGTPIDRETFDAMLNNDIFIPTEYILWRAFARRGSSGCLMIQGGQGLGYTRVSFPNSTIGVNAADHSGILNCQLSIGPVIRDWKRRHKLNALFFEGCYGGAGHELFTEAEFERAHEAHFTFTDEFAPCIFAMTIPIGSRHRPECMNYRGKNWPEERYEHFATAKFYLNAMGLDRMAGPVLSINDMMNVTQANTICFQGTQAQCALPDGTRGRFTQNQGHVGPDYPGVREIRQLGNQVYEKNAHLLAAK